jgi:hypothetical protein
MPFLRWIPRDTIREKAKRLARIPAEITFLAKEDAHESAAGPF